ncbi:hypothetical protein KIN20_007683 [Parelaphostrongylus tenuis]|uniref:Uncharacterized protein n=1 Tax=Parelaphostrongylus tenuis TaxID=148309 RepID=A0AAD5MPE3_PARTN|nr:hypothetical protein KIN20_007683 [Parelaphostrongylus tenuis]
MKDLNFALLSVTRHELAADQSNNTTEPSPHSYHLMELSMEQKRLLMLYTNLDQMLPMLLAESAKPGATVPLENQHSASDFVSSRPEIWS